MAISDEVIRLILDGGQFESTIAQLQKSTANYEGLIQALNASMAAGSVTAEEHSAQLQALDREYTKQSQLLQALTDAQTAARSVMAAGIQTAYDLADAYDLVGDDAISSATRVNSFAQSVMDSAAAAKMAKQATADQNKAAADTVVAAAQAEAAARKVTSSYVDLGQKAEDAAFDQELLAKQMQRTAAMASQSIPGTDRLGHSFVTTTASTRNMGFAIQTLGRGVQDFKEAGLRGITNNVDQLAMSLGASAAVAGYATVAIVGLQMAQEAYGPAVKEWFKAQTEGSNVIPKSADAVKRLDAEITKNTKTLEKYREQTSLTNTELRDYNKLTAAQIQLEEQKAEALKQAAALKEISDVKSTEEGERASGFRKAVADSGGGDKAMGFVTEAIQRVAMNSGQEFDLDAVRNQAEELMKGAFRGNKGDISKIDDFIQTANQGRHFGKHGMSEGGMKFVGNMFKNDPAEQKRRDRQQKEAEDADKKVDQEHQDKADDQAIEDGNKLKDIQVNQDAREKEKVRRVKQKETDAKAIESGLGDDFIAQAEMERIGIENDPTMGPAQKARARRAFPGRAQAAAKQRFMEQGMGAMPASTLAMQVPGFLGADIDRQMGQARAMNGGGNDQQVLQAVLEALQASTQANGAMQQVNGRLKQNFQAVAGENRRLTGQAVHMQADMTQMPIGP